MKDKSVKIQDFVLKGIDEIGVEKEYSHKDFIGKITVLYFYPKDNTPGCTQEACDFRDNFNRLTLKAQVIGVSADSIDSHKKFQKKLGLNFILLSDPEYKIMKPLEVLGEKIMFGKKKTGIIRSTFILDKDGAVVMQWRNVKVKGHVEDVYQELGKI